MSEEIKTTEVRYTRVTVEIELPFPIPHVEPTYAVGELLSKMARQNGFVLLDWHDMHEVTREIASDESLERLRKILTGPQSCPIPNCGIDHQEFEFCRA